MRTSSEEDRNFKNSVIPNSLLEDTIDWIGGNLKLEQVFPEDVLTAWAIDWAENNDYIKKEE